jgi:hypothetical protein
MVSVKMGRGDPRAGDEGLCNLMDLYEMIGGEVEKIHLAKKIQNLIVGKKTQNS